MPNCWLSRHPSSSCHRLLSSLFPSTQSGLPASPPSVRRSSRLPSASFPSASLAAAVRCSVGIVLFPDAPLSSASPTCSASSLVAAPLSWVVGFGLFWASCFAIAVPLLQPARMVRFSQLTLRYNSGGLDNARCGTCSSNIGQRRKRRRSVEGEREWLFIVDD
jgi:hypothetical protein